ncbi:MAG: hypothetical protein LW731_07195 [Oxalobacteraceae bacterium]|jgi:hypothetical protein|nr:hypothetical protein [Oxalobacteraceae bacterium]
MQSLPLSDAIKSVEKRLAVVTTWAFFGAFGMGFVLSGFSASSWGLGLTGYALLITGFIGHVLINLSFDTEFSNGEVALGLVLLGISALSLLGSWWLDPKFSGVNLGIALAGFAGMTACLLFYLVIKHGVRGTFSVIHTLRKR